MTDENILARDIYNTLAAGHDGDCACIFCQLEREMEKELVVNLIEYGELNPNVAGALTRALRASGSDVEVAPWNPLEIEKGLDEIAEKLRAPSAPAAWVGEELYALDRLRIALDRPVGASSLGTLAHATAVVLEHKPIEVGSDISGARAAALGPGTVVILRTARATAAALTHLDDDATGVEPHWHPFAPSPDNPYTVLRLPDDQRGQA